MSTEREWSLADRFVAVMAEVNSITHGVDNDNPHRHVIRSMRHSANKAIHDALTTAGDIAMIAHTLKSQTAELDDGERS